MVLVYRALPYLIVLALAAAALFGAYHQGVSVTTMEWQLKWNKQALELAEAKGQAEHIQREEERRRQDAIDEVRQDAEKQIQQAKADAAAVHAGAVSLRDQAQRLAATAGKSCSYTGLAIGSAPASTPVLVLADLFSGAADTAADLAEAYDRARAAGAACERAYDAVRRRAP